MATLTTLEISKLAVSGFISWVNLSTDTLNLTQLEPNVFRWVFWKNSEIKSVTILIKASTKGLENLYFQKYKSTCGLYLEMPFHKEVTHILWVDIKTFDSVLIPLAGLNNLLKNRTNSNDFNFFVRRGEVCYIVPLDYIECEGIGVRRRNLLAAA
jgi:hypothetical protein